MTFALMQEPVNGVCGVLLRRETSNKICVATTEPLTDEQMQDLYWIVSLMHRTKLPLKEIMKGASICPNG